MLQSLMAAHSMIASFPESHVFEKLFSGRQLLYRLGIASRHARPRWNLFIEELGRPELARILPSQAILVRQYARAFMRVLDTLTLEQQKVVWIEKTPQHLHYVNQIENLIPDVRFIHILRHGPDNIASLYEVGQRYPNAWGRWYGTLDQCIQRWVEDTRRSRALAGRKNHLLINYDDLVTAPREQLTCACEFAGVLFEERMLQDYSRVAEQLVLSREQWKASVGRPIGPPIQTRFQTVLTEEQRRYVLSKVPESLLQIRASIPHTRLPCAS